MKRILFMCLATLFTLTTWAGQDDKPDFSVDGIYYLKLDEGSVAVMDSAFQKATSTYVGDLVIPASVEYEGTPYTVSSILEYAFYNCAIASITLPETITSIGEAAFGNCENLTSVDFLEGFTEIPERLFTGSGLIEITIPESIETIGIQAFGNCLNLKEVTIGSQVTYIHYYAFGECTSLEKFTSLNPEPPTCELFDYRDMGIMFSGVFDDSPINAATLYVPLGSAEKYQTADQWSDFGAIVEIGSSITAPTVVTSAATDITNSTATLHGTVIAGSEEIKEQGFQYWSNMNSIQTIVVTDVSGDEISSTIQRLSAETTYTFQAYALTESGYTYGERKTFTTTNYDFAEENSDGKTIYYKIIGSSRVNRTCEVQYLYYDSTDNNVAYEGDIVIPSTVEHDGTTYNVIQVNDHVFYECRNLKSVKIPDSVTAVGPYSFSNSSVEEVTLPNNSNFTIIWYYTFMGCTNLKEVTIPSSVNTIREYAFGQSSGLEKMTIPNTVTTMYNRVFGDCVNLKEVTIDCAKLGNYYTFCQDPNLENVTITNSVVDLGKYTFGYCYKLKNLLIPNSVTTIGDYTFEYCTALADITLPNNLTEIADGLFFACEALEKISIPESVTTMGHEAFMKCIGLKEVTFPKNVTSIGGRICSTCSNLKAIYSLNPTPPSCDSNWYATDGWFEGINDECVLYVPTGSKETYSTTDVWKDFFKDDKIVEIDVLSANTNEATGITDNSAILNGSITKGTFDVTDQGFEYWTDPITPIAISIESDKMTTTLSDLVPSTTYYYRAYATDTTGTTYGETLSFTTDVPEGISSVKFEVSDVEGYYTTSGLKLNTPQKGINIVRYTDGTTKKVIMK